MLGSDILLDLSQDFLIINHSYLPKKHKIGKELNNLDDDSNFFFKKIIVITFATCQYLLRVKLKTMPKRSVFPLPLLSLPNKHPG